VSVTFEAEIQPGDVRGWGFTCYENGEQEHVFGDRGDAQNGSKQHAAGCETCLMYGTYVVPFYATPEGVNMANANAAYIMSLLGIEFGDGCGAMDASEFAARIGFAAVVGGGDQGTVTVSYKSEGGAEWHECGRPVGYADARLAQLTEVVAWAVANGRRVVWS